jgi:hypothetical protein
MPLPVVGLPSPLTTVILPPVEALDLPAETTTEPPIPLELEPTEKEMDPADFAATPVLTIILPDDPVLAAPV